MKFKFKIFISILFILSTTISLYAEKRVTIVYTNSLNGYFDDCHCKEHPKGGLVARGTEVKKIRKSFKNVFLFETGDFFPLDADPILEKYLVKGYKYLKYDMITFGDQEVSSGINEFLKYKDELPLINNNTSFKIDGKWKHLFKRYSIVQRNGIKAGVIGSMSGDAFKYYPKKITDNVLVGDQIAEIKKDLKSIKDKKVDIIILLSHSGMDQDKIIAQKIKGIDLIVGGHSQTLIKSPVKVGNTVIVQAGANGAHIGILELSIGKKIKVIKNIFRLPHLKITPEDKDIRKMIDEYEKEVKKSYNNLRFK